MRQVPWVFSKGAAGLWSSCRDPQFLFSRYLKNVPSLLSRASKMSLTSQSRLFSTLKDQKKKGNVISFKTKQCCFVVRNIKRSRFILIYHREIKCDAGNSRQCNFFLIIWSAHSAQSRKCQNCCGFPLKYQIVPKIFRISHVSQYCEAAVWINSKGEFSPTQMWKSALRSYFWNNSIKQEIRNKSKISPVPNFSSYLQNNFCRYLGFPTWWNYASGL